MMSNVVVLGNDWAIVEDVVDDSLWLTIDLPEAVYTANQDGVGIRLPVAVIEAIRGLKSKQVPHLREQRAAIFSERARKGWQTRRNENKAQQDADIRTLIGMPADAPKSVTEIRGAK